MPLMKHASGNCPHCRQRTAFTPAPLKYADASGYYPIDRHAFYLIGAVQFWLGMCNHCGLPVVVNGSNGETWPQPGAGAVDPRIPLPMGRDLAEAKIGFAAKAYRSAVVMARRALQGALLAKGASPKKTLEQQIDELRDNHTITNDIREWAHAVRWVGNDGAHPSTEEMADPRADEVQMTEEDATSMIDLAEQLLTVLFVAPALAQDHITKRGKVVKP
jgi:hypothetical protein